MPTELSRVLPDRTTHNVNLSNALNPRRWFAAQPARSGVSRGAGPTPAAGRPVRARYDVAQTTDDNQRMWSAADGLSADAATLPHVRRVLRNRARYEVANNSYAKGIALTLGNYVVGTGPRLQMLTGDENANSAVEAAFTAWASEVCLADKLRTMHMGRLDSGECFGLLTNNPANRSPVKLDLRLIESDQVADPAFQTAGDPAWADGIHYDDAGNPISYRVLKQHPGSLGWMTLPWDFDDVPAAAVLHYFRPDRPGQRRGIPDMTPALRLFNDLRRYSSAVIAAAETAADFAGVMHTNAPPDDGTGTGGAERPQPYDTVGLEKRTLTVLPDGYSLAQIKAEQPTTTYDMFVWCILREIARCLNIPLTIAGLDSSKSNLSAAYLDHQTFAMAVVTDRALIERLLERLFAAWIAEAALIPGLLPAGMTDFSHQWFWPSIGQHADPGKVASAQAQRLTSGTSTIPREYAAMGLDWESEQQSAAKGFGVSIEEYRALLRQKAFGNSQPVTSEPPEEPTNDE